MALKDRYAGAAAPIAAVSTAAPPPAPAAPVAPAAQIVSVLGTRDLGALRAVLAKGNTSPPEAAEALTEAAFEPKTRETPDGGAEPIPDTAVIGALPSTPTTEQAKRKRRTKAEMEAARAEAAERDAIVSEIDVTESGKVILERVPEVTDFSLRTRLDSITTDQLLGELLQRAQVGL